MCCLERSKELRCRNLFVTGAAGVFVWHPSLFVVHSYQAFLNFSIPCHCLDGFRCLMKLCDIPFSDCPVAATFRLC